jgi:NADH-quinone oxidoreductase subunit B
VALPLHLVAELNLWQQWLRIDLARFGSERVSFSPRQADMLMVMGTISKKMAYITSGLRTNVRASLVIAAVELVLFRWNFDTYSVLQGIDKVIP